MSAAPGIGATVFVGEGDDFFDSGEDVVAIGVGGVVTIVAGVARGIVARRIIDGVCDGFNPFCVAWVGGGVNLFWVTTEVVLVVDRSPVSEGNIVVAVG